MENSEMDKGLKDYVEDLKAEKPLPKIDWVKVWAGYKKKYPGSAIRQTNKNAIAELVEKQLRGEL